VKPFAAVVMTILGLTALAGTIWVAKYDGKMPVAEGTGSASNQPAGPAIENTGPFPKAVIDETEHDFGSMEFGGEGSYVFTIRNEGEGPLEVVARKEDTTCQCTFGDVSDTGKIAPGGKTDVTLKWGIKNPNPNFRHRATIRTNDPERRTIDLIVKGKVEQTIKMLPSDIWQVGEILGTEPTYATGSITSAIVDKFNITGFTTSDNRITPEWTPMTEDELSDRGAKSGYHVKVKIVPGFLVGTVSESLTLLTDARSKIENTDQDIKVSFFVRGTRPGPIELAGKGWVQSATALILPNFPSADGYNTQLSMFIRDFDGEVQISDVQQRYNAAEVTFEKDEKFAGKRTQRYFVKIKIPPGPPADHHNKKAEKITIKLNHPQAEEFSFYIDWLAL
jgi:hypothetical protein